MESINPFIGTTGLLLTVFAAIWSLAWWLSGQFTAIRNLIYTQVEKLSVTFTEKLEYHEKHDDQRFSSLSNDIWELRVRNAANDKLTMSKKEINDR